MFNWAENDQSIGSKGDKNGVIDSSYQCVGLGQREETPFSPVSYVT